LSLRNQELEAVLRELRQTQDQLVMKEKMASLGQLVAGVCHEINNPIGAINSAVQVLAKCVDRLSAMCMPALARSGQDANEEAEKLLNIVHDSIQTTLMGGQRVARIVAGREILRSGPS
jgi:signal transduction histidine kinase